VISYPTVNLTFSNGYATWTGSISCTTAVHLYGTTKLFYYPNGAVLASGTQINETSTAASSSGSYYVSPGNYEINFNVDITIPAGYTTTPGNGCYYINNNTAIHCTVGSGEFTDS
jgi:hypothetical protein